MKLYANILIALVCLTAHARADSPSAFLQKYCYECHGEDKQKGDRRFDGLEFPITDEHGLVEVQEIIDQLNLGEMPPAKSAAQPGEDEKRQVIAQLTAHVSQARENLNSTGAQTVLRRLNRREYRNTVADLFLLDLTSSDPTTKFPRDRLVGHMDNIGDGLSTSGHLLDQYLDAADLVVEKALGQVARPEERSWHFKGNFQQGAELQYAHKKVYNFRYLCLYEVPNTTRHEGGYAYIHELRDGVPADGVYEIRALAHSVNRDHPYDRAIFGMDPEQPYRMGIVPGDLKAGILHHPQPIEPQLAEVTVEDGDPQWYTMTVWLNKGQTPRFIFPNGMADCRGAFGKIARQYKDHWPEHERKNTGIYEARRVVLKYGKMPHIRIHEVKVRGPLFPQWPPEGQQQIFGDGEFDLPHTRRILKDFADRAYRRPARTDEIDRLVEIAERRRAAGQPPRQAVNDAIKAILCSPSFLYLAEPSEGTALGPHDLAVRLSYFLWATMPDEQLRRLADDGTITRPAVLREQTRRLLTDPRSDRFITGFHDSWLNLRALGGMPPDRDTFKTYYSKDLETAMRRETQLFTRGLITGDRPVSDYIDSDYTFVNADLAKHYGLAVEFEPRHAHLFKRIALEDRRRGGLLGMGSVLTVTANGIETSPVHRGVWFLENFLGTPPPPPPDDVPTIDPDVRGTTTVREQLTKHRDSPACFQCHQKIDAPGFALENFDPVGAWRSHYQISRRKRGPEIDASATFANGESFDDIVGFKRLLGQREEQFTRHLTEQLLSYATGRRIEPAHDRPEIDQIVSELEAEGGGLRSLLEKVVTSTIFRSP